MTDLNGLLQERGPHAVRRHLDAIAAANKSNGYSAAVPKTAGTWQDHVVTAAALKNLKFPPVAFVIPGLIPEGLSILAGRPKVGKSWLGLDVCLAIAGGRPCLDNRQPDQGDVLYCALEDNGRRLQRRLRMLVPIATPWPERLKMTNSWLRLDRGGVDDIESWADSANKPRLVVIDTLAGVRPVRTSNGYNEDYEALGALHRFANDRAIAVVVLHHTRKMDAEDPIDTVSGTFGITGCADTILVLARSYKGTTLYVRGRDIEEAAHAVVFDKATCRWAIHGEAREAHSSDERKSILAAFRQSGKLVLGPQGIADIAHMPHANVRKLLGKMVEAGELEKDGRGRYRLPELQNSQSVT